MTHWIWTVHQLSLAVCTSVTCLDFLMSSWFCHPATCLPGTGTFWCFVFVLLFSTWRLHFKQSHVTAKSCTKVCFWKHLRQEIGNIVSLVWLTSTAWFDSLIWVSWSGCPALCWSDLICIKLSPCRDYANSHTVAGPSTPRAISITHYAAGSPALNRKWTGSVDGFGVQGPWDWLKTI